MQAVLSRKATDQETLQRLQVFVQGAVQGVGFRPFIYRLASELGLSGWVNNSSQGVNIEVEGPKRRLDSFLVSIEREKPPRSFIQSMQSSYLEPVGYSAFEIRPSRDEGGKTALILPDIATCPDCLHDIFDPSNRRYLYPFTNCTNCGPRFTIVEALPYDRSNTTMKGFVMCERCRAEYEDPLNRRFHAQPNACPKCGPHLELWTPGGSAIACNHNALFGAGQALREGAVVAVKGLGGFQLMVDARNEEAVYQLRQRKHREEKPFALMYQCIEDIEEHCEVSPTEARLLQSPEAPIVLLKRRPRSCQIAPNVAPHNPYLGAMLPYTPLHHLLMREVHFPVVATSGNLSDEPICTDEKDALVRLAGVADLFLVHNRPIARHADDSVTRVVLGREMVLRRARGYAPLPIRLKEPVEPVLAVGAHQKNCVALAVGRDIFISQHVGDLETTEATQAFERVIGDLQELYDTHPATVACDAHPEYLSTKFAEQSGKSVRKVQHHAAHVFACMAENELDGPVLGVSWDGTGYGLDGTVWGGEFLRIPPPDTRHAALAERVAHLRTFRLPGGERAVREPRRIGVALLYELFGETLSSRLGLKPLAACTPRELGVWQAMMRKGINSPLTSSAGRLFDGVASLIGLRQQTQFEGQAAMELEYLLNGITTCEDYGVNLIEQHDARENEVLIIDWEPILRGILSDLDCGVPLGHISARFHNSLAESIVLVARKVGEEKIALTGGCFQNKYLLERSVRRLIEEGFRPYWHQRVPPNDGGIALGQIMAVARKGAYSREMAKV